MLSLYEVVCWHWFNSWWKFVTYMSVYILEKTRPKKPWRVIIVVVMGILMIAYYTSLGAPHAQSPAQHVSISLTHSALIMRELKNGKFL